MTKVIDINKTIYELAGEYPEIIDILVGLGFADITKPGMLKTAGRFMTLPKGAALKRIAIEEIIKTFNEYGFEVKR